MARNRRWLHLPGRKPWGTIEHGERCRAITKAGTQCRHPMRFGKLCNLHNYLSTFGVRVT